MTAAILKFTAQNEGNGKVREDDHKANSIFTNENKRLEGSLMLMLAHMGICTPDGKNSEFCLNAKQH